VAEESVGTDLGLLAPSDVDGDSLTITVTGLPSLGRVTLADGSAVSNGQVLSSSELTGLKYDAPADYTSGDAVGSFTYSVNDGTTTVTGTVTLGVTPINDAPVADDASLTVAEESVGTDLGLLAPSDVDGDSLTITVTGLPTLGRVTLADGSAVSNGQVLSSAETTRNVPDSSTDSWRRKPPNRLAVSRNTRATSLTSTPHWPRHATGADPASTSTSCS
jgi:hypothetical protein